MLGTNLTYLQLLYPGKHFPSFWISLQHCVIMFASNKTQSTGTRTLLQRNLNPQNIESHATDVEISESAAYCAQGRLAHTHFADDVLRK